MLGEFATGMTRGSSKIFQGLEGSSIPGITHLGKLGSYFIRPLDTPSAPRDLEEGPNDNVVAVVRAVEGDAEKHVKAHVVAQESMELATVPATGAAGKGSLNGIGCCGGAVAGGTVGLAIFAVGGVWIWGTGVGLYVEGGKADNEGVELAGKIMLLYASTIAGGLACCCGTLFGAMAGSGAMD